MEDVLYKLFHSLRCESSKRNFVKDKCRCSTSRGKKTLKQISENELSQMTPGW